MIEPPELPRVLSGTSKKALLVQSRSLCRSSNSLFVPPYTTAREETRFEREATNFEGEKKIKGAETRGK